ncbi:ABC transporter permease [Leucobacter weissii]|uniref:ABC transporter permease n=1 Tax=Leucobacter weissii TaxID=1983706 RepID=A0A939MI88_9MICO|nr:ABC transporter permease [Leucobacter weissii]MBO1900510.1 ABC transporter permease [Leucobacter weissii]
MTPGASGRAQRGHPLLRMLALRVLGALALLFVISVLVFSLVHLAPGDIVRNILGPKDVSPEAVAVIREQYRLDDPVHLQYLHWLGNALSGDLGQSVRHQSAVADVIFARAGNTVLLALGAFVLAAAVSIPLGVLSALRPGSALDRSITVVAILGISAPAFATSLLLLYVFAFALGWFPLYGIGGGGADTLWHLVLPSAALALGLGAILTKITRTAVIRELEQEYIVSARARGLPARRVRGLALRNAAIPIVTGAGLVLTYLVGGAIFVETVFALPGIGTLLEDAVIFKDVPVVQAVTLLVAAVIVGVAIVVDLLYAALDPRLRR